MSEKKLSFSAKELETVQTLLARTKATDTAGQVKASILDRLRHFESLDSIETDSKKGENSSIPLTNGLKSGLFPLVEAGLYLQAKAGRARLQGIAAWGEFLCAIKKPILEPRRIFTWFCKEVGGFSRQAGYNYVRLWEKLGSRLPEYAGIDLDKLLAVARHYSGSDVHAFIDKNREEIIQLDERDVRKLANPSYRVPRRRPQQSSPREAKPETEERWEAVPGTPYRRCQTEKNDLTVCVTYDGLTPEDVTALDNLLKQRRNFPECKSTFTLPEVVKLDEAISSAHDELAAVPQVEAADGGPQTSGETTAPPVDEEGDAKRMYSFAAADATKSKESPEVKEANEELDQIRRDLESRYRERGLTYTEDPYTLRGKWMEEGLDTRDAFDAFDRWNSLTFEGKPDMPTLTSLLQNLGQVGL